MQTKSDVNLTQIDGGLRKIALGASWTFQPRDNEVIDVDLSCFALGRDNTTREDEDFVFYNNPQGAALSIRHLGDNRNVADPVEDTDDEVITVDLDSLSFDVWAVIFVVSIYQGNEHDVSLGHLRDLTLRIRNAATNIELHRTTIPGGKHLGDATALRVGELYRNGTQWYFSPATLPFSGGLAEIARGYGIQISSTT